MITKPVGVSFGSKVFVYSSKSSLPREVVAPSQDEGKIWSLRVLTTKHLLNQVILYSIGAVVDTFVLSVFSVLPGAAGAC